MLSMLIPWYICDIWREAYSGDIIRAAYIGHSKRLLAVCPVDGKNRLIGMTYTLLDDVTVVRWNTSDCSAVSSLNINELLSITNSNTCVHSSLDDVLSYLTTTRIISSFYRESCDGRVCHVSDKIHIDGEWIVGEMISADAKMDGFWPIKIAHLSRIDIGTEYEASLSEFLN